MGLLSKFKNIFIEEYDEDEEIEEVVKKPVQTKKEFEPFIRKPQPVEEKKIEIKKEEVRVQVPEVKIEQKPKIESVSAIKEEETIKIEKPKKEEKFIFPVYFDEKDFVQDTKPAPKPAKETSPSRVRDVRPETREVKKEVSYKESFNTKKLPEKKEKKVFRPTPIISPVYGILDKNYYKEDLIVNSSSHTHYTTSSKSITIDDVRNKAFGSLEDDLEGTLMSGSVENQISNSEVEEDTDSIINANDFETAFHDEDEKEEAKDSLKTDMESLISNQEFADLLNFKKTKIEDIEAEEIKKEESKKEEPKKDERKKTKEKEDKKSKNDEVIDEDTLIDDIVRLATEDEEKEFSEKQRNEDVELSSETDNAYENVDDLDDNDLFNLIDSMYDKEDK